MEGWKPRSIRRLATSIARMPCFFRGFAVETNSCIGGPENASGNAPVTFFAR